MLKVVLQGTGIYPQNYGNHFFLSFLVSLYIIPAYILLAVLVLLPTGKS